MSADTSDPRGSRAAASGQERVDARSGQASPAGIADHVFASAVRPRLPELAALRADLARGFRREAVGLVLAAAAGSALAALVGAPAFALLLLAAAGLAGIVLYVRRRRRWTLAAIDAVVPPVCRALGDSRHEPGGSADHLRAFEALGLVPAARHRILSHRMVGSHAGTRFEAQHATLARTRGRRGATRLFHGLLIRMELRSPAPATAVIVPAGARMTQVLAGVVRPLLAPGFERVPLADERFERRFSLLAVDAGAAKALRACVSPDLRAALLDIDAGESGGRAGRAGLAAALHEHALLLVLPRVATRGPWPFRRTRLRPFLDPGGFLRAGPLEPTLRTMAEDAALPHRIAARVGLAVECPRVDKTQAIVITVGKS